MVFLAVVIPACFICCCKKAWILAPPISFFTALIVTTITTVKLTQYSSKLNFDTVLIENSFKPLNDCLVESYNTIRTSKIIAALTVGSEILSTVNAFHWILQIIVSAPIIGVCCVFLKGLNCSCDCSGFLDRLTKNFEDQLKLYKRYN